MKFLNKLKKIIGRETAEKTVPPTKIDSIVTMEGEELLKLIQMHVDEALAKERSSKEEKAEQSGNKDAPRKDIYTWCNEDEENLREIFLDKKIDAFKDKIGKVGSDTPAEIAGKHFKNIVDGKFDGESDNFSIEQEIDEIKAEKEACERELSGHGVGGYFTLEELKNFCKEKNITYKGQYDYFREQNIHSFGYKMPASPFKVYSDWVSYDDLFGRKVKKEIVDYDTFKELMKRYNLKKSTDYTVLRNSVPECENLPSNPNTYYADKWISWHDVINNVGKYFTFDELKKLLKERNIKTPGEYQRIRVNNAFELKMPWRPSTYYRSEWKGWNDFLGLGAGSFWGSVYYTYEELKEYVQKNNIKTPKGYYEFRDNKEHEKKMPMRLFDFYRNEWIGWNDFLGLGADGENVVVTPVRAFKKKMLTYQEFKNVIIEYKIYRKTDYLYFRKKSPLKYQLPELPQEVYDDYPGWITMVSQLLKEDKEYEEYYYKSRGGKIRFEEDKTEKQKIIPQEESKLVISEPPKPMVQETIPHRETLVTKYSLNKDGTINVVSKPSINSLLIQQKNDGHLPFEKAREIVRKFKFKNKEQFNNYLFKPVGIPEKPDLVYFHTGWESWDDFLGNI